MASRSPSCILQRQSSNKVFSSYLAVCVLEGSLQSEGKSFEIETVTPPLRLIDFRTFTGHVAHINIHMSYIETRLSLTEGALCHFLLKKRFNINDTFIVK